MESSEGFYVQLPMDRHGNTGYPLVIASGAIKKKGDRTYFAPSGPAVLLPWTSCTGTWVEAPGATETRVFANQEEYLAYLAEHDLWHMPPQ